MDVKSLAGRWEQQSQDQNKLWEEQIKRWDERNKQFHELMASFRERKGMYTNCLTEVPRRDLPIFEGINPRLWLRQCNKYFKVYNIPENQRMEVASLYMVGRPKVWMSSYMETMKGADWTDVICCLVGNYRDKIGLDIEDQEFKKWEDSFLENYRVDCEGLWKNSSETIPEKHDYLSLEDDHEEKVVADVVMDQKDIQEDVPVEKFLGEAEIAEEDVIDVLLEKLEMFDGVLVRDFDNTQSEDGAKKDTMEVNKDIHDWVKSDLWTELSNGGELCKFIECHDVVDYAFTGNLDFVFTNGRKVKPLPWRDKNELVRDGTTDMSHHGESMYSSGTYWGEVEVVNSNFSSQVEFDIYIKSPSVSQDQLYSIVDFSSKCAYLGTNVKLLITGKFLNSDQDNVNCTGSCRFWEIEVPAGVVAEGVLCCQVDATKEMDENDHWYIVGVEVLRQGNNGKLSELLTFVGVQNDVIGRFHTACYLEDVLGCAEILINGGHMRPLPWRDKFTKSSSLDVEFGAVIVVHCLMYSRCSTSITRVISISICVENSSPTYVVHSYILRTPTTFHLIENILLSDLAVDFPAHCSLEDRS